MMRHVSYLCLESTREGQAPHAHVHEIIKGLESRGWSVTLFEPSRARDGLLGKVIEYARVQLALWRHSDAEVIYVRSHLAAWPTSAWARLRRIPIVQEINGPPDEIFSLFPALRLVRPLVMFLSRSFMRGASASIAVTPQLAALVEGITGRESHLVPNGANTDHFRPGVTGPRPTSGPYVIFFGALAPWQGLRFLLQATASSQWPVDVSLVIVGDGAERDIVARAAASSDRIIYLGRRPYGELPALIGGSLGGVIPKSTVAGHAASGLSPLKLYETLACGVPAIVSDIPGQADLVRDHDCGLVVPPHDGDAIANAVRELYGNPERRTVMGAVGRKLIESAHSWDMRAEDTSVILSAVAAHVSS